MKRSLGIIGLESIHYYVHDLDRTRKLYCEKLDFAEIGASTDELDSRGKQHSVLFQAGQCRVVVSEPRGVGGRAWRFLQKHPEGVGTLVFRVEDIETTFQLLEERGGTTMCAIQWRYLADGTRYGHFSITTPFGDTTFRFVQRERRTFPYPGFKPYSEARGGNNRFEISHFDHVTSNFPTMQPVVLWLQEVLGFQRYWNVAFHTNDLTDASEKGSGLKSIVMWDPTSKVKFALNEPARPNFKASQINVFNEAHRGSGVQHIALAVVDIQKTVKGLLERKVAFMPTPDAYYDALPARLERMGVGQIDEPIETLRSLGILVDGEKKGAYMLQIFMKEQSDQHQDHQAGPFFLEIIQRCGDKGFGAGNFRALFESIEREQTRRKLSRA